MAQVCGLDDLREYVNEIFCERYELQIGTFNMTERLLRRGRKPCGMYFCLHGPNSVKLSAIWDTEQNQILFYGSSGKRFQKTKLAELPSLMPCYEKSA